MYTQDSLKFCKKLNVTPILSCIPLPCTPQAYVPTSVETFATLKMNTMFKLAIYHEV